MSEKEKTYAISEDVAREFRLLERIKTYDKARFNKIYEATKADIFPQRLMRETLRGIAYGSLTVDGLRYIIFSSKKATTLQRINAMASLTHLCESSADDVDLFTTNEEMLNDSISDWNNFMRSAIKTYVEENAEDLLMFGIDGTIRAEPSTVEVLVPVEDVIKDVCSECKNELVDNVCHTDGCSKNEKEW